MPPYSYSEQQVDKKKLIDWLYKERDCICALNLESVRSLLNKLDKVDTTWVKNFLIKKNETGFSIPSRFMDMLVTNKELTPEACEKLLALIRLLLSQLDPSAIDQILLEKKADAPHAPSLVHYLFNALRQSQGSEQDTRIQALASCLEMLLEKISDALTISDIVLELEEKTIEKVMSFASLADRLFNKSNQTKINNPNATQSTGPSFFNVPQQIYQFFFGSTQPTSTQPTEKSQLIKSTPKKTYGVG
jgi:hypothetical protein